MTRNRQANKKYRTKGCLITVTFPAIMNFIKSASMPIAKRTVDKGIRQATSTVMLNCRMKLTCSAKSKRNINKIAKKISHTPCLIGFVLFEIYQNIHMDKKAERKMVPLVFTEPYANGSMSRISNNTSSVILSQICWIVFIYRYKTDKMISSQFWKYQDIAPPQKITIKMDLMIEKSVG